MFQDTETRVAVGGSGSRGEPLTTVPLNLYRARMKSHLYLL